MVSAVRSYFHLKAKEFRPSDLLSVISKGIESMNMQPIYMGLVIVSVNGNKCTLASAGMPPSFWYRAKLNRVQPILLQSLYLGTGLVKEFPEIEFDLSPGDILVLMSDGFSECRNKAGEFLTEEIICNTVLNTARTGTQDIVEGLRQVQRMWTGAEILADDSTILTLKYLGPRQPARP